MSGNPHYMDNWNGNGEMEADKSELLAHKAIL